MNRLTDRQRRLCAAALNKGAPLAVWRAPGGANFTIAISAHEPQLRPVFEGDSEPSFVIAPFDSEDGNLAYHLIADVLLTGDQTLYRNGHGFTFEPMSEAQAELSTPNGAIKAQAPEWGEGGITSPHRSEYEQMVSKVIDKIRDGHCEKVVLSRVELKPLDANYDLCAMVEGLTAAYPQAFVALVHSQVTGTWIVATPETLLTSDEQGVKTMALAGTQWPDPGTDISSLDWPEKIQIEQGLVVDYISDAFSEAGIELLSKTAPHTVQAANLCHLRSDFQAAPADDAKLAALLRRLHPTSAVCGSPKDAALEVIKALEGSGRTFYTGYLGPRNIGNGTSLYVNLRSARISGEHIFLHVGGGIVEQSDPAVEWNETVAKTQTIMKIL